MSALFPVFISTFLPRLPIMRSPDLAWAGWAGRKRKRGGERGGQQATLQGDGRGKGGCGAYS